MNELIVTMTKQDFEIFIRQTVGSAVNEAIKTYQGPETTADLLNKAQAAKLLNCCISTIDNLVRAKRLERQVISKKGVRFKREDVLAIANNNSHHQPKTTARYAKR